MERSSRFRLGTGLHDFTILEAMVVGKKCQDKRLFGKKRLSVSLGHFHLKQRVLILTEFG